MRRRAANLPRNLGQPRQRIRRRDGAGRPLAEGEPAMNDLAQFLCIPAGVLGGVYCISLLWECRKRTRSRKEPLESSRVSTRRHPVSARINSLLQVLLSATFLTIASLLLAGLAYRAILPFWCGSRLSHQQRRTLEKFSLPGDASVVVDYDSSQASWPLTGIECAGEPVSDDHLRGLLREAPQLWYLNLTHTEITDNALRELRLTPRIRCLTLDGTRIGDRGLQHLASLNSLEELDLQGTSVTDRGLRCLADLRSLRTLNLRDTAITDAGLEWLSHLDTLAVIDLAETHVTREGVRRLQSELPGVVIIII